ncbi:hypothetical protein EDD18DRAFT_1358561 [Armillaria luteobubalina]|uniref:GST N-terminal domain-containing protein n=1 Tax=Armillaria luteobubalina TaxID=153913 RepID=A0AA39UPH6_9AGAR|nr:hypothetical protein EDD18DRAFT_1358561 [Armillaria luteobubalina]
MTTSLTLYDIPSTLPSKAWLPNIYKVRYVLNYKGLAHHTEWVEFPDIEALYKRLGAQASETKDDGVTPHYTCPLLHDHSTGALVSDSAAIARYPRQNLKHPLLSPSILNLISEEYGRRTREARMRSEGKRLEDMVPKGGERESEWVKLVEAFRRVDRWYGKGDRYVMGDVMSYADFMVSMWAMYFRTLFGEDSEEWKDVVKWHGGRWGRLVKDLEKYETVL